MPDKKVLGVVTIYDIKDNSARVGFSEEPANVDAAPFSWCPTVAEPTDMFRETVYAVSRTF